MPSCLLKLVGVWGRIRATVSSNANLAMIGSEMDLGGLLLRQQLLYTINTTLAFLPTPQVKVMGRWWMRWLVLEWRGCEGSPGSDGVDCLV